MRYRFKIDGTIPSKKNELRAVLSPGILKFIRETSEKLNLRMLGKFTRVKPSKKYLEWEEQAVKKIVAQTKGNLYIRKCEIWFRFYFARKGRAGGDTDNKVSTIFDMLRRAGVLMEDHYECIPKHHVEGIYRKGKGGVEFVIKDLTEE